MKKEDLPFPEIGNKSIILFGDTITKSDLEKRAETTIKMVDDGNVSAMEIYIHVRAVRELCEAIEKGIKDKVLDEAERLMPEERSSRGVKLELVSGRTTFDFSHDSEWNQYKEMQEETSALIKEREKLMKDAVQFAEVYDKDGIRVEPAKVVGGTAPSVRVIIPK